MARRQTRIVLLVPWDDEEMDHPAGWDWTGLLDLTTPEDTLVIDFEEVEDSDR